VCSGQIQLLRNRHHDKSLIKTLEVENFLDRRFLLTHLSGESPLARWVQCTRRSLSARHSTPLLHSSTTTRRRHETEPDESAHHSTSIGNPPGLPRLSAGQGEGCLDEPGCRSPGLKRMAERTQSKKAKEGRGKGQVLVSATRQISTGSMARLRLQRGHSISLFPPKVASA
jgi:hypothetical protein